MCAILSFCRLVLQVLQTMNCLASNPSNCVMGAATNDDAEFAEGTIIGLCGKLLPSELS